MGHLTAPNPPFWLWHAYDFRKGAKIQTLKLSIVGPISEVNRQSVRDASISKNEDFELKCTEWLLWKVFMPN